MRIYAERVTNKGGRTDGGPGDVRTVDHIGALAALANPDRVRLMDALAVHGPSTTSALAGALGLATGSISHHLKVLRDAGLVDRAPEAAADRRERRWKLVTRGIRWSVGRFRGQPAGEAAAVSADAVFLGNQYARAQEFLRTAEAPWDDAAYAGHYWLRLSPEELVEFGKELDELLLRWRRRPISDDQVARETVFAFARAFPSRP